MYDRELAPAGLELSQFTLLTTLDLTGDIPQKTLATMLAMDSTTLTRTLRPLLEHDWVRARAGEDRRMKLLGVTAAGRRKLAHAQPHWERAQARLQASVPPETWQSMGTMLAELAAIAE
jgi:DNA-binding MarR family transcriptional regulator